MNDDSPSDTLQEDAQPAEPQDENAKNTDNEQTPPIEEEICRMDDRQFAEELEELLKYGEEMRVGAMRAQRNRGFVAMSVGLTTVMLGASGFGWYLLVEAEFAHALGSIMLGLVIAVALHLWSMQSLSGYKKDYKTKFLPRMAKLLGGFKYHPTRGISRKLLAKTGVVPGHEIYEAEDCFMGRYNGVKVLFSEARLRYKKKYMEPIFNGLFVLLEVPETSVKGHTIITADQAMVKRNRGSRWKAFEDLDIKVSNTSWNRFTILSNKPEAAHKIVHEKLLKELSEASDIFENSPLTCVFFRGKFVFLMIPYEGDMFEASDIHVPVTTKRHAMHCKKEIEKILEIVDVFDLYQKAA